ncbi:MAG: sulfotransferase family 2 domain-containing protein [Nocardioidaceae bacterium]|nr:sulfotransferase family 2 domain-containing protein [Nocardioidaceae bacterium]
MPPGTTGTTGTQMDGVPWRAVKRFFPGRHVGTFVLALPDHDLVYVKNAKAGCSTILAWLDHLHTGSPPPPGNIHQQHRLPRLREVGRDRLLEMLGGSAYRFSFVRNPRTRLESTYWNKVVPDHKERPRVLGLLGILGAEDRTVGFEEFLDAVEHQVSSVDCDPHWRPQHLNLLHPVVRFNRIGRLESFAADLDAIQQEAGLPRVPAPQRNVSRRADTSVFDGRPDLVQRVETIYATDYELYGY